MQELPLIMKNDELTNILVTNISRELGKRNWSLRKLSDRADLPYETVKKLINRKIHKPSFFSVCRIAAAFEISIDALLGKGDLQQQRKEKILSMNAEIKEILLHMEALQADFQ